MIKKETEEYRALRKHIREFMANERDPHEVLLRLLEIMADVAENVLLNGNKIEEMQDAAEQRASILQAVLEGREPEQYAAAYRILVGNQAERTKGLLDKMNEFESLVRAEFEKSKQRQDQNDSKITKIAVAFAVVAGGINVTGWIAWLIF